MARTGEVSLSLKGLTCDHCVAAIRKGLSRIDGVLEARVTLDPPRAVVSYDAKKVGVEKLLEVVTEAGYEATVEGGRER
jgi:copper ion binding protein